MILSQRTVIVRSAALAVSLGIGSLIHAAPAEPPATTQAATQSSTTQAATTQSASTQSTVVVTVNGKDLSTTELANETRAVRSQLSRQFRPEQIAQMEPRVRQQAVANLVNKHLLQQEIIQKKVTVSDEELKTAVADVSKNIPPGQTLDEALKQVGFTHAEFIKQMTESLGIQKLLAEAVKNTAVTDDDLKTFYAANPDKFKQGESVSARHILVQFAPTDDDAKKAEKKKKAEAVRERLVKGEDFAKVCAETSDDPGSKDTGGLYENFTRGKMVPPFEHAAFTQKVGDIGPLVETTFGYHIIKVEKHTEGGVVPLADVKDRLKSFLENQKKQEATESYIRGLRSAAKIAYAEGYAPPPETAVPTTQKN